MFSDVKIWNENCEILKKVFPRAWNVFQNNHSIYSSTVQLEISLKGFPSISVQDDEQSPFLSLHSKYDPQKEAKRFLDSVSLASGQHVVVFGLGLGYHLRELLARGDRWILVIEGDIKNFWGYCHFYDLKELYQIKNLHFLLAPSEAELFSFLQPFTFSILANGLKVIKHQASYNLKEAYYRSLEKKIRDFKGWAEANILTQIRAANLFSKNVLENLYSLNESVPLIQFKNQFKGIPAIIVSGGPSLTKNGYLLKRIGNNALIFAVDTAVRFLIQQGISPDFIVSTDFTTNASHYLEMLKPKEEILLVDPEVHPDVVEKFKGTICFCNLEEKALCNWIKKFYGDFGTLPKGISVSHTAFSAAMFMGANPIVFLGQDLAFSRGRTHFKGASHGVHAPSGNLTVPGIFCPVPTSPSLKVFLDHFEDLIRQTDTRIINATEGGAIIQGTEMMTFREFLLNIRPPSFVIKEKISKCYRKKSIPLKELLDNIQKTIEQLKSLRQYSEFLIKKINELSLERENLTSQDPKIKTLEQAIQKLYNKYPDSLNLIRDNMIEAFIMQSKKIPSLTEINPKDKESFNKNLQHRNKCFQLIENASKNLEHQMTECFKKICNKNSLVTNNRE